MLKKGFAWHYTAYDQRPELATVRNFSSSVLCFLHVKHESEFSRTRKPIHKHCNFFVYELCTSGKKRLKLSELACGLHQILRSHGNGERTNAKVDDIFQTGSKE